MKQSSIIDETDAKILQVLIMDARSKLKDIAEECELSPPAIKNLKNRTSLKGDLRKMSVCWK